MNLFSIALLQLHPQKSMDDSLFKGLNACEKAKEAGADLALFPELWSIGYHQKYMKNDYALKINDDYINFFCKKAQELEIAIALPYLAKAREQPTNNVMIIDKTGTIILNYAKVNICSFEGGSEVTLQAGSTYPVASLSYAQGSIKIGAMICFDREFIEPTCALATQGAELIIVPNACFVHDDKELGNVRLAQIRSRSFENKVALAVANYPAPFNDGNSCISSMKGQLIIQADTQEKIVISSIDLDALRLWQKNEPWGPTSII